jgi:DivIVA domain-containing protein
VNGDEVRNVRFSPGRYSAAEVNDLLERVAAELDAGRPAGPLIADAVFPQAKFRSGHDTDAVDWFLDQLRRCEDPSEAARADNDPWRDLAADHWCFSREPGDPAVLITEPSSAEYADDWRDFDRQPGTRLWWVRTGTMRGELRTEDQQAVASFRYPLPTFVSYLVGMHSLSAGRRTFTITWVTPSAWAGTAGTVSRDPLREAHMLRRQTDDMDSSLRELLDDTGTAVLYKGGRHFDYHAGGYIKFPGQRWLRFPVRGHSRGNAIMTAVDQAGNKVARYRFPDARTANARKTIEVVVHPDHRLTEELALAIAVSARWVNDYFIEEHGGG